MFSYIFLSRNSTRENVTSRIKKNVHNDRILVYFRHNIKYPIRCKCFYSTPPDTEAAQRKLHYIDTRCRRTAKSKKNSLLHPSDCQTPARLDNTRRSRRGRCRDAEPNGDDRLRVRKRRGRGTGRSRGVRERRTRARTRERPGRGDGGGGSRLVITRWMDLRAVASGRFVTIDARK